MTLDLAIDEDVVLPAATRRQLRAEIARMVTAAARADGHRTYEVGLRLTTDATIRELNRDYRNKDKPTDVLAFAQREGPAGALQPEILGDLVISVETARAQAKRGLYAELLHLASHGLAHLLGYDHRDDEEERVMNAKARALRKAARPAAPAAARPTARGRAVKPPARKTVAKAPARKGLAKPRARKAVAKAPARGPGTKKPR